MGAPVKEGGRRVWVWVWVGRQQGKSNLEGVQKVRGEARHEGLDCTGVQEQLVQNSLQQGGVQKHRRLIRPVQPRLAKHAVEEVILVRRATLRLI